MYPGSDLELVVLRPIMDISARAFSLADRPRWAIWVTRVRPRREDRTSISSHSLADLGRYGCRTQIIACSSSGGLGGRFADRSRFEVPAAGQDTPGDAGEL